ncbi:MAG: ATP phosphoribosyltransferase [Bacteroidaceae bacterium]|nr:ATP phosphoribosyltransferase [Bacteroidaceae bacterium]
MVRIAVQTKGRLNEQSMELLSDSGIKIGDDKRKFLMKATDFPVDVLFLRDDDIPQTVSMGAADLGIVGLNEVVERGFDVEILQHLGFGACRISLAIPKSEEYDGLNWFQGKRIATSYPGILRRFFDEHGIKSEIHTITGSVEISPAAGLADGIFDIVSSGGTLVSNGLKEVEVVLESDAVLISTKPIEEMEAGKQATIRQLMFRFDSVRKGRGKKYLMMNLPEESVDAAIDILPSMKSPTVIPLAQKGWCSLQTVVEDKEQWTVIEELKAIGAEDILVMTLDKVVI